MGRHHAMACIVEKQSGQQMMGSGLIVVAVGPLIPELLLDSIEKCAIYNGRLLARQDLVLHFANVTASQGQKERRLALRP
jgi:hypothetical protein